jgi:uncharacterized Zn finger protein
MKTKEELACSECGAVNYQYSMEDGYLWARCEKCHAVYAVTSTFPKIDAVAQIPTLPIKEK